MFSERQVMTLTIVRAMVQALPLCVQDATAGLRFNWQHLRLALGGQAAVSAFLLVSSRLIKTLSSRLPEKIRCSAKTVVFVQTAWAG